MIIHNPKIKLEKNHVCISTRIEFEKDNPDIPDILWYRFPKKYKNIISRNSNGFLIPLVPAAMSLGEDIHVKGEISSQLAYNLREYQRILNFWKPEWYKVVEIKYDRYEKPINVKKPRGVMCSFSGGVDSFYTLWKHLPQNEPNKENQVTHALYLHGLDIPLRDDLHPVHGPYIPSRDGLRPPLRGNKRNYNIGKKAFTQLTRKLDISLLTVSTNALLFFYKIKMPWTDNSIVFGAALFFDNLISRFYYSENYTLDCLPTAYPLWMPSLGLNLGRQDLLVPPLMSTEKFEIISHGATVPRLEKIKTISKWPETYNKLRVCWDNPDGLMNCCRCEKCERTMCFLDIAGALNKYSTFPLPIDRKHIRSRRFPKRKFYYPKTVLKYVRLSGRKDIAFDYAYVLSLSKLKILLDPFRLKYIKIKEKLILTKKNLSLFFDLYLNPLRIVYKISFLLRQHSRTYSRFVDYIKDL